MTVTLRWHYSKMKHLFTKSTYPTSHRAHYTLQDRTCVICKLVLPALPFLAHLSRRLSVSLKDGTRAGVRASISPFTLSNMNIFETSCPIKIKFHQEHHWGGGLTALGLGQDRIRTLVSMATDIFHRVIMGKSCDHSSSFIFDWLFFILADDEDNWVRNSAGSDQGHMS